MSNTARTRQRVHLAFAVIAAFAAAAALTDPGVVAAQNLENRIVNATQALSAKQLAIPTIAAAAALGDMARLNSALNEGLDAGLAVSEIKEVLVQLYAYAGFPRSLNALGEFMKVLEARKQRGVHDALGREAA